MCYQQFKNQKKYDKSKKYNNSGNDRQISIHSHIENIFSLRNNPLYGLIKTTAGGLPPTFVYKNIF